MLLDVPRCSNNHKEFHSVSPVVKSAMKLDSNVDSICHAKVPLLTFPSRLRKFWPLDHYHRHLSTEISFLGFAEESLREQTY